MEVNAKICNNWIPLKQIALDSFWQDEQISDLSKIVSAREELSSHLSRTHDTYADNRLLRYEPSFLCMNAINRSLVNVLRMETLML